MPPKCFGGLPGCTTTDSLLYLVNNIKNTWRKKHVATIVFLDIAGTFPNAVTSQLLLNMRKLAYPTELKGSSRRSCQTTALNWPSTAFSQNTSVWIMV